jgi:hypothetical protein
LAAWSWIASAAVKLWDSTKTAFANAGGWLTITAGKLWDGVKSGFNTFVGWYLSAWQGLFNALISGVNKVLPASMQVQRLSFADDFKNSSRVVAPVPSKSSDSGSQILQVNLDGKKLGEVVIGQMAKQAAKPQTSPQGYDLLRSRVMPGTSSTVYPRG